MFNDRANYPMIPYPPAGAARPSARYPPGTAQYQQAMAMQSYQPASKRQRTGAPGAPVGRGQARGNLNEDEWEIGELIDHLSQRDVAVQRFTQHHEWLEEAFASPYATGNIQPVALGFGLVGELEPVTRGIFNPPNAQPKLPAKGEPKTYGVEVAAPLSAKQEKEFAQRVADRIAQDNAEIEEMARQHQERLASLEDGSRLVTMERQLRRAVWEDSKKASGAMPEGEEPPTLESLVKAVEGRLGSCTEVSHDIRLIERGGLQDDSSPDAPAGDKDIEMDGMANDVVPTGELQNPAVNSAADTPSFSDNLAAPSTSISTPKASIPAPPTAVAPKTDSGAGDVSDYIAVDRDAPSAPNAGPEGLPATEPLAMPQNGGVDDIGDDLLDFDGDGIGAGVEGDLYTGGAFEEAMELTDPADSAAPSVPAPDAILGTSAPSLDAAATASGPQGGMVTAQIESLMTDDGGVGYGSASDSPRQGNGGLPGIDPLQPTLSEAPAPESSAATTMPTQPAALPLQGLGDPSSGV